jgi:hypothetical protein
MKKKQNQSPAKVNNEAKKNRDIHHKTTVASTAEARCATTLDSSPKKVEESASAEKAKPELKVANLQFVAPENNPINAMPGQMAQANPVHPVNAAQPQMRDRRNTPEGRRGRFAEKTPPGTRTKMLKIIYEHRAEFAEKKRNQRIIKAIIAAVLCLSAFYAVSAFYSTIRTLADDVSSAINLEGWWETVSKPTPAPVKKSVNVPQKKVQEIPRLTRDDGFAHSTRTLDGRREQVQQQAPSRQAIAKTKQPIVRSNVPGRTAVSKPAKPAGKSAALRTSKLPRGKSQQKAK